jgi:hypothetical protein
LPRNEARAWEPRLSFQYEYLPAALLFSVTSREYIVYHISKVVIMVSLKLSAFALFALKAISAYAQVRSKPMASN